MRLTHWSRTVSKRTRWNPPLDLPCMFLKKLVTSIGKLRISAVFVNEPQLCPSQRCHQKNQ
jgi:hypothetical protein